MVLPLVTGKNPDKTDTHIAVLRDQADMFGTAGNESMETELDRYCDFFELLEDVVGEEGGYYSLTEQQLTDLKAMAEEGLPVSANARAIVNFLNETVPYEDALPYNFERKANVEPESPQTVKEISDVVMTNIPNPFESTTTISGTIERTYNKGEIQIRDLSGRLIGRYPINGETFTLSINLSAQAKGIYTYSLSLDGVVVKTQQMVVQ